MTIRPFRDCLVAAIVTSSTLAAYAESPAVEPSKPDALKPGSVGAPSADMSPQAKMALKLAGLVAFVANSCPELKPDYARFKATVAALGVDVVDLEKPGMKTSYLAYTSRYNSDVKTNCAKAREQFGPDGKSVPGIFTAAK